MLHMKFFFLLSICPVEEIAVLFRTGRMRDERRLKQSKSIAHDGNFNICESSQFSIYSFRPPLRHNSCTILSKLAMSYSNNNA